MELKVQNRQRTGSKVKNLRKEGFIPAVIYSKKIESVNIKLDRIEFEKAYKSAGETEIIDLKVEDDKKEYPVLIDTVQIDPVSGEPIHVNFRLVDLTKVIRVNVPIEFVGEEEHPLIKSGEAIVLTQVDEIEVEVLPKNLPKEFEISVLKLKEIGDTLTLEDLVKTIDTEKIKVLDEDLSVVIASLDYALQPEIEEEEEKTEEELIGEIESSEQNDEEEGEGEGEGKEEGSEKKEEKAEEKKEE